MWSIVQHCQTLSNIAYTSAGEPEARQSGVAEACLEWEQIISSQSSQQMSNLSFEVHSSDLSSSRDVSLDHNIVLAKLTCACTGLYPIMGEVHRLEYVITIFIQ